MKNQVTPKIGKLNPTTHNDVHTTDWKGTCLPNLLMPDSDSPVAVKGALKKLLPLYLLKHDTPTLGQSGLLGSAAPPSNSPINGPSGHMSLLFHSYWRAGPHLLAADPSTQPVWQERPSSLFVELLEPRWKARHGSREWEPPQDVRTSVNDPTCREAVSFTRSTSAIRSNYLQKVHFYYNLILINHMFWVGL